MFRWLFCLLIFVQLQGCSPQNPPVPMRLGTNIWPGYELIHLANHQGFYGDSAIEILEFRNASQVMVAVKNGLINAAALTLDETLNLMDEGVELEVIAITDISNGGDVLLAHPSIQTLQQLKGRTLAVEQTALGAYMLQRVREVAGLLDTDLRVIPVTVDKHLEAYQTQQVDAIITFEPSAQRIRELGAIELFSSKNIPGEVVDVVVVVKGKVDLSTQLAFLNGYQAAWDMFHNQQPKALTIISERLKLPIDMLTQAYKGLILPDLDQMQQLLTESTEVPRTIERLSGVLARTGINQKPCQCQQLINTQALEAHTRGQP